MHTNKFATLSTGLSLSPEVFKTLYSIEEIEAVLSLMHRLSYDEEGNIGYDEDEFTELELHILDGLKSVDNQFGIVANVIEATITCFLGIQLTDKDFISELATVIEPYLIENDAMSIKEINASLNKLFTIFSFRELTMIPPSYTKVLSFIGSDTNSVKILDVVSNIEIALGEDVHEVLNSFNGMSLFLETAMPEAIIDPVTNHGILRSELLEEVEIEELINIDENSIGKVVH